MALTRRHIPFSQSTGLAISLCYRVGPAYRHIRSSSEAEGYLTVKYWGSKHIPGMSLRMFGRSTGNGRHSPPILPSKHLVLRSPSGSVCFPKRYARVAFLVVVCLSAVAFFYRVRERKPQTKNPPLYERYHEYEANLPQHNLDLPYPEGRDAKFLWVSNHITGACLETNWSCG